MVFPLRDVPEQDPSRTGFEGTAAAPAPAPATAPAAASVPAAAPAPGEDTGDGAGAVAYAPPPLSFGATGGGAHAGGMHAGGAHAGDSAGDVAAAERWRQILAMFVDDPRGSVTQAAGLVDEAISAFVAAARGQQASLASSWKDQEAGTEELRKALQEYRTFWRSVTGLSLSAGAGRYDPAGRPDQASQLDLAGQRDQAGELDQAGQHDQAGQRDQASMTTPD